MNARIQVSKNTVASGFDPVKGIKNLIEIVGYGVVEFSNIMSMENFLTATNIRIIINPV